MTLATNDPQLPSAPGLHDPMLSYREGDRVSRETMYPGMALWLGIEPVEIVSVPPGIVPPSWAVTIHRPWFFFGAFVAFAAPESLRFRANQ